jgi:hypothetical protein
MTDVISPGVTGAVRASDAEREKTAALLRRHYSEGRLTLAELEERASASYQARTLGELRVLTADLPGPQGRPAPRQQQCSGVDPCLFWVLLFAFPPGALVYWLMSRFGNRAAAAPGTVRDITLTSRCTMG